MRNHLWAKNAKATVYTIYQNSLEYEKRYGAMTHITIAPLRLHEGAHNFFDCTSDKY